MLEADYSKFNSTAKFTIQPTRVPSVPDRVKPPAPSERQNGLVANEPPIRSSSPSPISSDERQRVSSLLGKRFSLLNRGFVRLVDYMGSDAAIVQAARVSYGKGTKKLREDRALIRYLMRHCHNSPFEMCELKLHVKLPIFVARQWVRHRTASLNEYSARYSEMNDEFYIPAEQGEVLFAEASLSEQSQSNRQGRDNGGASFARVDKRKNISDRMQTRARNSYAFYKELLSEGLAREVARISLPLSTYTEFYWKTNLHNLLHFLGLRMDKHAQEEIRLYAHAIFNELVQPLFPLASEAFIDYRLESSLLSRHEVLLLRKILSGNKVSRPTTGFSEREWQSFLSNFQLEEKRQR